MANTTEEIDAEQNSTVGAVQAGSNVDGNVSGALSYLFGFITGLIFYLSKRDNSFVRWHAAQSMAFNILLAGVFAVLTVIQLVFATVAFSGSSSGFVIGGLVSLVLGLVWLVVAVGGLVAWVYLMVKAYQGGAPRMPVAARIADRLA